MLDIAKLVVSLMIARFVPNLENEVKRRRKVHVANGVRTVQDIKGRVRKLGVFVAQLHPRITRQQPLMDGNLCTFCTDTTEHSQSITLQTECICQYRQCTFMWSKCSARD